MADTSEVLDEGPAPAAVAAPEGIDTVSRSPAPTNTSGIILNALSAGTAVASAARDLPRMTATLRAVPAPHSRLGALTPAGALLALLVLLVLAAAGHRPHRGGTVLG